jgi:hypothetical protein
MCRQSCDAAHHVCHMRANSETLLLQSCLFMGDPAVPDAISSCVWHLTLSHPSHIQVVTLVQDWHCNAQLPGKY